MDGQCSPGSDLNWWRDGNCPVEQALFQFWAHLQTFYAYLVLIRVACLAELDDYRCRADPRNLVRVGANADVLDDAICGEVVSWRSVTGCGPNVCNAQLHFLGFLGFVDD